MSRRAFTHIEAIALLVVAVIVAGIVWLVFLKGDGDTNKPDSNSVASVDNLPKEAKEAIKATKEAPFIVVNTTSGSGNQKTVSKRTVDTGKKSMATTVDGKLTMLTNSKASYIKQLPAPGQKQQNCFVRTQYRQGQNNSNTLVDVATQALPASATYDIDKTDKSLVLSWEMNTGSNNNNIDADLLPKGRVVIDRETSRITRTTISVRGKTTQTATFTYPSSVKIPSSASPLCKR